MSSMLRAKDTLKSAFTPDVTIVMRAGGLSDSTAGLYEAKRAKVENSVRTRLVAEFELRRAIARFHLRQLYLKLRAGFIGRLRDILRDEQAAVRSRPE